MARKSTKTPAEITAELEKKLAAAKLREAMASTQDNPHVARLSSVIDDYSKEINVLSRKLKGPNSFENRLKSADLRTAWIRAEQAMTVAEDAYLRKAKQYVQTSLASIGERIGKGEKVSDADISDILNRIPEPDGLADLRVAEMETEAAWREFVASLKVASKGETPSDPVSEEASS